MTIHGSPPYSSQNPLVIDGNVTFSGGVAGAGITVKNGCHIWYVDSGSTSTSEAGDSWQNACKTLAAAVALASPYDVILIAPNTIETVAATGITITTAGLRIFGANYTPGAQNSALKIAAGTAPMFTIKADRVEIAGLCLSQRTAYACIQIGDTAGQAYYNTYIHDCNFDGYGTATYGISPGPTASAANNQCDPVNLVVEDCYFSGHVTAAIVANGTRDTYRRNTIRVATNGIGISQFSGAGDRDYTVICDNYLFGLADSTTKGILFAASPTAGTLVLARNYLCGTWDVTITDVGGGCMNYVTDANGGALINC